ncbi:carbohydrate ABC transporter ATP-binding protein (CUT1 family) [Humitalea rosea]|uniref:Carbohydrate ABC transporter ATP-binding protein (CUT1 family) n=1 Tax=Humitalea rosea TaxID=990373 RepID=A0A2W7IGC2_9PROT|nr:ABC transporter ATP-binding protein [Humitalea rosea]PZW45052.1 carbohydrate ABC transporter ATP-binding protein (CUT1 family) [Humitalea rosea]
MISTQQDSRGAIRLDGVAKSFGSTRALADVTLSAPAGTFLVLLGPSGCGKSTLLRVMAGLEAPAAGRLFLGGRDVAGLPPAARGIAMVFQSYALFPHLSVAENIVFGLRARGTARGEREARLARAADMLGLGALLARRPSQLSGGQQQRVALARAVVAEAPICLMDEPLSNLDAKLRAEMRREIRALQQRLGLTMVYVTHDQAEAMSMADQVVLMREGRIEQDATPAELYARPATVFAASFIGTPPMSLLRLEAGQGGAVIAGLPGHAVAPAEAAGGLLGVRPEEVVPTDGHGLPAAVLAVEFLGAETVLSCALGTAGQMVQARVPGHHAMAAGTPLRLRLPPPQHLFDAATGRRLPDFFRAAQQSLHPERIDTP